MDIFINISNNSKFILHYKKNDEDNRGFHISGHADIDKVKFYSKEYAKLGYQVKVDSIEHINIENLIFDYFHYFRGKI